MNQNATYRKYLLTVLLIILAFNFVDRLALGLLLQDIKSDLELTDTQLGVLTGFAFGLFYSIMGVPIAQWADRGNRITIISITTGLWSAAVALCAVTGNFFQLLLARVAVAVGEAGCVPAGNSLIADYFDRSERPRAIARYMLGAPLSVLFGYFVAGWLNELFGWRATFIFIGLPGVALAGVAWLTMRDPRVPSRLADTRDVAIERGINTRSGESTALPTHPPLKEVSATLWRSTTFRHLLIGFSVLYFFGYGIQQWLPAFFIRNYGLTSGELGTWFALIYGSAGILGTYLGGELAFRHASKNERLQLRTMAAVYLAYAPVSALVYIIPNRYVAFGLMWVGVVGISAGNGPLLAVIQALVPDRMRAQSIACVYLFANLIGMGLGPLVVGALSDTFRHQIGEESLRYALLALCPANLWGAWHLWIGSRTVARDVMVFEADSNRTLPC